MMEVLCCYSAAIPGLGITYLNSFVTFQQWPPAKADIEDLFGGLLAHAITKVGDKQWQIVIHNLIPLGTNMTEEALWTR